MQTVRVEISKLLPNPRNPRRNFSESSIVELAASIEQYGLLSPLVIRRVGANTFELIAGERRLRALKFLERKYADAVVLSAYDLDCQLISLIENLQREDLHYLDQAEACRRILEEHGLTQEELAHRLGRSPSAIANLLRLLRLSPSVQSSLREAGLSERHARALLRLPKEDSQLELICAAKTEGLSVRQLETRVDSLLAASSNTGRPNRHVTCLFRDGRMFVNAVLDTVRELNRLGVCATSRVNRLPGRIEITITLPEGRAKNAELQAKI